MLTKIKARFYPIYRIRGSVQTHLMYFSKKTYLHVLVKTPDRPQIKLTSSGSAHLNPVLL